MKKRSFVQNKLWRDKAVAMMEATGSTIHWQRLDDDDDAFDAQLRLKMVEESNEIVTAKSKKELLGELADVSEVIDALLALHNITQEDLEQAKADKRQQRGGFEERCFVTVAEHCVGSFCEKYCLADSVKYPEVKKI